MGSTQYGLVGCAGIEPDIQSVGVFDVRGRLIAQHFLCGNALPDLNARGLYTLCNGLKQLGGAGMEGARFFMNKKRHRHAPLPLAR